jgi:hypothetical protein
MLSRISAASQRSSLPTSMRNLNRDLDLMLAYSAIALAVTSFRLAVVRKNSSWKQDDLCATLATCGILAQTILMSLRIKGVTCGFSLVVLDDTLHKYPSPSRRSQRKCYLLLPK